MFYVSSSPPEARLAKGGKFQEKAFTLIELLIVIAITATLATGGILSLLNYSQRRDLALTGQEIVTVLRNAQDNSMSQEGGGRWGVYFSNPASGTDFYELFKGISYTNGTITSKVTLGSRVQFSLPASGSNFTVVFSPITGLPNAATTIRVSLVSNSQVSTTIIINMNGKIQY